MVETALDKLPAMYPGCEAALEDFNELIHKTIRPEDDRRQDWEAIENVIGAGWVAEETLAISIFCVLRHIDNFEACVISAVNHGGDSDSTGAVAGNIIGAILGYSAIPEKYRTDLQLHDLLQSTADDLSGLSSNKR